MMHNVRPPAAQVHLPLQVGTRVDCKWRDGAFHTARVVELRTAEGRPDEHEYYVHYLKCAQHAHSHPLTCPVEPLCGARPSRDTAMFCRSGNTVERLSLAQNITSALQEQRVMTAALCGWQLAGQ